MKERRTSNREKKIDDNTDNQRRRKLDLKKMVAKINKSFDWFHQLTLSDESLATAVAPDKCP